MVVYHGTNASFSNFEPDHSNGWSKPRRGFYFTDDFDIASEFGKVRTYRITLNNPADFTEGNGDEIIREVLALKPNLAQGFDQSGDYRGQLTYRFTRRGGLQTDEFISALLELGYDGMIFDDALGTTPFTSYVVFDASNIYEQ